MENISLMSSFLKMIFALAVVLGLMIGIMYFLKNFMNRPAPSGNQQDLINIVHSKYLGPKSSIMLIEVMDQLIVVGISGQQMTTLAHIDDPLFVEKIKARRQTQNISFSADKISRLLAMAGLSTGRKTDGSGK